MLPIFLLPLLLNPSLAQPNPQPTFGYHGITGPTNWYTLNPAANHKCALGRHQSPINIVTSSITCDTNAPVVSIPSYPDGAEFHNLGTTVEVPVNGTLTSVDGKVYNLAQFHFHTPSEHAVDGEYAVLEVHFVFVAGDGERAVVGFLIELGEGDALLEAVLGRVGEIPELGDATHTGPLDFAALERHLSEGGVYRYSGSLTTPPCDEDIAWHVSCEPLTISAATYQIVKDVVKFNARFTQNTPGEINVLENVANGLCGSA